MRVKFELKYLPWMLTFYYKVSWELSYSYLFSLYCIVCMNMTKHINIWECKCLQVACHSVKARTWVQCKVIYKPCSKVSKKYVKKWHVLRATHRYSLTLSFPTYAWSLELDLGHSHHTNNSQCMYLYKKVRVGNLFLCTYRLLVMLCVLCVCEGVSA